MIPSPDIAIWSSVADPNARQAAHSRGVAVNAARLDGIRLTPEK